jgi:hypothetical protein
MAWIKVNLNGEDVAIYKGEEVWQILPTKIVGEVKKGRMEIFKDGILTSLNVVLESDCKIEIRAKK